MEMQQDFMQLELIKKESVIIKPEISDGLTAKPGKEMEMFKVVSIGPGHYEHGTFHKTKIKKGDTIYLIAFMSFARDAKLLIFGRARDVIAVA